MLRTTIVISALVLVLFAAQGSTRNYDRRVTDDKMPYGSSGLPEGMPQDTLEELKNLFGNAKNLFSHPKNRSAREAIADTAPFSPGSEPSIVERDDNIDIDDIVASNPFDDSSKSGQQQ